MKKIIFIKIIKFLYKYICRTFNIFSTLIENLIYKKTSPNPIVKSNGYLKYKFENLKIDGLLSTPKIRVNNYLCVRKLGKKKLNELLLSIFNKEFRDYITNLTGFEYSIDYMIMYDREYINLEDRERETHNQWYSYKWHFDKPNSNNTLKLILPLNITENKGPLLIINKINSKKIKNFSKLNISQISQKFIGKGKEIYGFFPSLCIHKDGIPKKNNIATQIMFQLNPYHRWSLNENIYNRQPRLNNKIKIWTNEPKFPMLSYLNDKRNILI